MKINYQFGFLAPLCFLLACGGTEEEKVQTNVYVPFDWNSITYDWSPPSLIASVRDASGETGRPAAASAYVIIVSDEALGTTSFGEPAGSYSLGGPSAQFSRPVVTFADSTKRALRIDLRASIEGRYTLTFAIPDARGNTTWGTVEVPTKGSPTQAGSFVAYGDPVSFSEQGGTWVPSGSWYSPNSATTNSFGVVKPVASTENPNGLPVFRPPVIANRVRGPNYTWKYEYVYQYPCPAGYYCPPASSMVANPPVIPDPILTGLAGEITKICWEIDCGGLIGDALIDRGLRAIVPRRGG